MKRLLFVTILAVVFLLPVWAQSAAEKELIKVENDWGNAWVKGDAKFAEMIDATEFVGTDIDGVVSNKADDIKSFTVATVTDKSFSLSDVKVHIYGQTGVVTGRNLVTYKQKGKPSQNDVRFTDVFVKHDGRWQCVATQWTSIKKK
jgi:ketosteroid isomerase-like protein